MNVVNEALALAARGISVFPCQPDKSPATAHGFKDAATDPAAIRAMFQPDHLIGVPTGPASGFDVLDLDPRHGSAVWFAANGGRLPPTRVHVTRGGGQHWLFRHTLGMRGTTNNPAPGCDVRADGGYVIWWPAHDCDLVLDEPLADWPIWLLQALEQRRAITASKSYGDIAPPSLAAVREVLAAMPNTVDRETYVRIGHAAAGCGHALGELDAVGDAFCEWAAKWPDCPGLDVELAKWADDFSTRDVPKAGWFELIRHARRAGVEVGRWWFERAAADFPDDLPEPDTGDWRSMLALNDEGKVKSGLSNAITALRHAPEWRGRIAHDDFAHQIVFVAPPPWHNPGTVFAVFEVGDRHASLITKWMLDNGIGCGTAITCEAVAVVAHENAFHPVRRYLDSLRWDGVSRIDAWLIDHLGAADNALNRAVGAKFLISAVARVRDPGCQVDTMLVLEGRQGLRKSTALRTLAGSWFNDHLPDLTNKDAALALQGVLIQELAEMAGLHRSEVARVKAYATTRFDRFRPPYGRKAVSFGRQSVFAATVNPGGTGYLRDETGARRYWTVECGRGWEPGRRVDVAALQTARDQMWAEAEVRHRAGERWFLDTRDLEEAQEAEAAARYDADVWTDRVVDFISDQPHVRVSEILDNMQITPKDQNTAMQMRVGGILRALGWSRKMCRIDGKQFRIFVPPRSAEIPGELLEFSSAECSRKSYKINDFDNLVQ